MSIHGYGYMDELKLYLDKTPNRRIEGNPCTQPPELL